jgi:hypothetical protein
MNDYADLEVGLHGRDGATWRVELRYNQPGTDADVRLDTEGPLVAALDPDDLVEVEDDEEAYGRALGEALLAGQVGEAYRLATAVARSQGTTLRVRLLVGPSAADLHTVRWETIRDPRDGSPLATDENIVFSRYLSSLDWRPVGVLPKAGLQAVALVAGPEDSGDYGGGRTLAPVDVDQEVQRARAGLGPLSTRILAGRGRATEDRLFAELHDECDVLYLVCHGYLVRGGDAVLLLENAYGGAAPLRGSALVERIRDLQRVPRLVVLASCQSGGGPEDRHSDDGGVLAALGPRLAEAGVPAVLAMQGDVSMATVARFMPVFFHELDRDGQIDRAVAAARATVRDRADWWVPTLFMRLRSGRLWYTPGFGRAGSGTFEKWPALFAAIRRGRCTPILGPGMSDKLLGPRQDIAQRWAKKFRFPMAPQLRDDLPQVAQYLSVNQFREFPADELGNYLRTELVASYGDELPAEYRGRRPEDLPLGRLVSDVWRVRKADGSSDPYAALADLPLPIYITTQPVNLLAEALRAAGKNPHVETLRWKELDDVGPATDDLDVADWAFQVREDAASREAAADAGWPTSAFERDPHYHPQADAPLVYHLFGHLTRQRSLVLTEDDYFDFLIGVTRDRDLVPPLVRRAFADSALMFLGFRLDEWDFRVLFRSILSQEGNRRGRYAHVAVQIDPEEGRTMEPERAREYFETYFQSSDITIYWGSTESFVKELRDRWARQS